MLSKPKCTLKRRLSFHKGLSNSGPWLLTHVVKLILVSYLQINTRRRIEGESVILKGLSALAKSYPKVSERLKRGNIQWTIRSVRFRQKRILRW